MSEESILEVVETLRKAGGMKIILSLAQPKRFTEIWRELSISGSTISRRLAEFSEKGLVDTEFDPKEKIVRYKLTEKGQRYRKVFMDLQKNPEEMFISKLLLVFGELKKKYPELNRIPDQEIIEIVKKLKKE
jgi:DNA-binding HxlR family transcriptional regulator